MIALASTLLQGKRRSMVNGQSLWDSGQRSLVNGHRRIAARETAIVGFFTIDY
jgi:hypothetical protein